MGKIAEILLDLIKNKGLSYGELSMHTGIPKSALQRYATGETEKIPLDRIELLAKALQVNPTYLMGWDVHGKACEEHLNGEIQRSHKPFDDETCETPHASGFSENAIAKPTFPENSTGALRVMPTRKKCIPVHGRISVGVPMGAAEYIKGYEWVDDASLDYALVVKGDSMIGARIYEGDIVFVDQDAELSNGDIVVALVEGDAFLRRFYQYGEEIILRPENPTQTEQHYGTRDVQILGKVKEAKYKVR
jgi:repressor LexA